MNNILYIIMFVIIMIGMENYSVSNQPESKKVVNIYSGSGSRGGLLTFSINRTDSTYSVYNEIEKSSYAGKYAVLTDKDL
jgi:hypothetical protein